MDLADIKILTGELIIEESALGVYICMHHMTQYLVCVCDHLSVTMLVAIALVH